MPVHPRATGWLGKLAVFLTASALVGCGSPQIVRPTSSEGQKTAEVLVYREAAFNSGLVALHFGERGQVYLALRNGEYGVISVPAGKHRFTVGANATQDYEMEVVVAESGTTCIKTYADPSNYAKAFVPILMNITSTFLMDVVDCPDEAFLQYYRRVDF